MKTILNTLAIASLVATPIVAAPAQAAPPEDYYPPNYNTANHHGTGCLMYDATGEDFYSGDCRFDELTQFNPDGTWSLFKYNDHGYLPAAAVKPDTIMRVEYVQSFASLTLYCSYPLYPNGRQDSNCHN